jgi:tetratricopeptide (TPR) repeat protein
VKEGKNWPPEWLSDLHSAYTILLRHPLGTDGQVLWHYELLDWLGAHRRASRVLREGIARFRDSPGLHARLRDRILKWRGPDALEAAYDKLLEEHQDPARLEPFAAEASVAAAEQHRKQKEYEKARGAYGRAIAHYERAVEANAGNRALADPAIALVLAGRARVSFQLNDDEGALADILASFARAPNLAGTRNGMNETPGETAQYLLARLKEEGKTEEAARLEKALSGLDQELLRPDRGLEDQK